MDNKAQTVTVSQKLIWLTLLLFAWPCVFVWIAPRGGSALVTALLVLAGLSFAGSVLLFLFALRCPACRSRKTGGLLSFSKEPFRCPDCGAKIIKK